MDKTKLSFKLIWCGFWPELRFKKIVIFNASFHSLAFMSTVAPNFRISHIYLLCCLLSKNLSICKEVKYFGFFFTSQFLYLFPTRCQKQKERKEGKKKLI